MLNWFIRRLAEVHEKKASGEAGFTLIELLVVIIIIGILAAIAIPAFLSQRDRAEVESARANVRNAGTAQQAAYAEVGNYVPLTDPGTDTAGDNDDLEDFGFRQGNPTVGGTGSAGTFCVSATGGGQTYRMTQDMGRPVTGTAC